jgi:hypothetical protein
MYEGNKGCGLKPSVEMSNSVERYEYIDLLTEPSNKSTGRISSHRCLRNKTNALQTTMLSLITGWTYYINGRPL